MGKNMVSAKILPLFLSSLYLILTACNGSGMQLEGDFKSIDDASPTLPRQGWDFSLTTDYEYDPSLIEVTSGKALLRPVGRQNSILDFARGLHLGSKAGANGLVMTSGVTDLEMGSDWTPSWSDVVWQWKMNGSGSVSNSAFSVNQGGSRCSATGTGSALYSTGLLNQALDLSGSTAGAAVSCTTSGTTVETDQLSLGGWVKIVDGTPVSGGHVWRAGSGGNSLRLSRVLVSNDLRFEVVTSGGTAQCDVSGLIDGSWRHYLATLSGGNLKIYVDGALANTCSYTPGSGFASSTASQEFFALTADGQTLMDEWTLWKRALTAGQVLSIYQQQSIAPNEMAPAWTPHWANLVGYWKFNGNFKDSSGKGNDFVDSGSGAGFAFTTTLSKAGGQSVRFDGTGSNIQTVKNVTQLGLNGATPKTILAWARPEVFDRSGIYNMGGGALNGDFSLHTENSRGWSANIYGNDLYYTDWSPGLDWVQVGMVFDGTEVHLYQDGRKRQSRTEAINTLGWDPVKLGQWGGVHFRGAIDEMAMWDVALSEDEIWQIFSRQRAAKVAVYESPVMDLGVIGAWSSLSLKTSLPFGKALPGGSGSEATSDYSGLQGNLMTDLVGAWSFDGARGDIASSAVIPSTRGPNGVVENGNNSGMAYEDGVLRQGIAFQGGFDDFIRLGTLGSLGSNLNQGLTLAFWFRTSNVSDIHSPMGVTNGSGATTIEPGFNVDSSGSKVVGTCRIYIGSENGTADNRTFNCSPYQDGRWHHWVETHSLGATKSSQVYIDGALVSFNGGSNSLTGTFADFNTDFTIGNIGQQSWGFYNYFRGSLDEVAIWNRPLTAAEAVEIYRRGANRLQYQVRSCATADCAGVPWQGPRGNDLSFFSESMNASSIGSDGYPTGLLREAPLSLNFSDFGAAGLSIVNRQFFQYRVFMEAETNQACSGSPCEPALSEAQAGPTGRYYAGAAEISNRTGVSFTALSSFTASEGGTCSPAYQVSLDGETYSYWNGSAWVAATPGTPTHSSSAADIREHLASLGTNGNFFWKALLKSDGTQSCELSSIQLDYEN